MTLRVAYTVCSALVPSRDSCRIFALVIEMHFPLDNSVCRVESTCPLVQVVKSIFPLVSCRQFWTWMSIYGELWVHLVHCT